MSPEEKKRNLRLVSNRAELGALLTEAGERAREQKKRLSEVWGDLKVLLEMVQAYWRGEYRTLPLKSLLSAVTALVYFINPLDLLPDVLLFGLVDDILVLGWVLGSLKADLDRFRAWSDLQVKI